MNDDTQNVQGLIPDGVDFSSMQLSAVAEIENISMGSAATAVSNLLSSKVLITTPQVRIIKSKDIIYPDLEPSIQVKINYTKGVHGSNTMILKQDDVQMMLNQLMGLPLEVDKNFVFDEMNISAVCEVMNQMMGAASTAISEFLEIPIDISTPDASIHDKDHPYISENISTEGYVVEIKFRLTIDELINSEFISIIDINLAKELASSMLKGFDEQPQAGEAPKAPQPVPQQNPQPSPAPVAPQPVMQQVPPTYQQPVYQQPVYQQPMYQQPVYQQPVNVQTVQLHQFDAPSPALTSEQHDNLGLLMNVPLNVSVELGTAVKKVREILEFTQGTIIELDRQAGAPVDIVVNGHLIARGDVVVIDDNFAVRVTEIVKSKFLDSLGNKE